MMCDIDGMSPEMYSGLSEYLTGGAWLHITQGQWKWLRRHHSRLRRSKPGTRAVGSSMMQEFTGGLTSKGSLHPPLTILAGGISSETPDGGRCQSKGEAAVWFVECNG